MRRFLLLFFIPLVSFLRPHSLLFAQGVQITGKIVAAEDKTELPGVSILIKGTTTGVISDVSGNYSITVPQENSILVFSFVGYAKKEIVVTNQAIINVELENDATELETVVITGYGDPQDKRKFTGAVAQVDAKLIENVPTSSFDAMLQGRAPGVMISAGSGQPGSSAFVRIRGIGSTLNVDPLYIVDGVPISSSDFSALNPNDFESFNILKDAVSASMYGSRGANGVIVITTKHGKNGIKMNYNFQYGVTTRTNTKFNMMNTNQKIQFERMMAKSGLYLGEVGKILDNDNLSSGEKEQQIANLARIGTNWTDVFFRTGRTQMHEINASGGADKTHYFVSANYRKEDGIIVNSNMDRYTLRVNIDEDASDKFSFGLNNSMGYTKTSFLPTESGNNINNPVLYAFVANPYTRVKNPGTGKYEDGPTGFNLVEQMANIHNLEDQVKLVTGVYLRYEFLPGLVAKTNWGMDYNQVVGDFRINAAAPNQSGINGQRGLITQSYGRGVSFVGTNTLQYSKSFSSNHSVRILVAQEMIRVNSRSFNFRGYGLNDKLGSAAAITDGTPNNNFIAEVGGANSDNALLSYFIDGGYTFMDRVNLSFGLRKDGSSRFGKNNRYANFYSIGGSWNLTSEQFMKGFSFVNDLKLRASFGTSGNQNGIGNFQSLAQYGPGANYAGESGIFPIQPEYPDLKWEEKASFDIGTDFKIFDSKISGTIDFYNNVTSRLFTEKPLSFTSGFDRLSINGGKLLNRGIEVEMTTTNLTLGAFVWTTNFNVTFNKNKILELAFENDATRQSSFTKGKRIGTFSMVEWAGVNPANGDPLYRDKNGNITNLYNADDAVTNFGSWDPPRFGGITNTFNYKAIELSVFFSFQQGNVLLNNQRFFNTNPLNFGQFNQSVEMLNAWQNPGDVTNIPRVDAQREFSSQDLEDASFIRLRNLSIGYFLPQRIIERASLSSVKFYLQGQNLLTFTRYSGFDPEDSGGTQLSQYPVPRVFVLGLNIGF